jgi:hypothetical protein
MDSNALVKPIGGDSIDSNLLKTDSAHYPEPGIVPAGQSGDEVCVFPSIGNDFSFS